MIRDRPIIIDVMIRDRPIIIDIIYFLFVQLYYYENSPNKILWNR